MVDSEFTSDFLIEIHCWMCFWEGQTELLLANPLP